LTARKTLGVMTYIDDSPDMLQEFGWLYKSWIHSGNWRTSDLIVVHNPRLAGRFPVEEGVVLIPCEPACAPGTVFEGYPFINSIACLAGPHIDDVSLAYEWLLRTDADTFLTKHLVDFRPSFPVHGRGHYHRSQEFREKMLDFCARHGVVHQNHFGCGSSLLARSGFVVDLLKRQTYWCAEVLKEFGSDRGHWPGWFRGVASMYAAEIAANEAWVNFLFYGRERVLDVESFCTVPIDAMVYHIHALVTDDYFSKGKFRAGAYDGMDLSQLDLGVIGPYCHWLAATPVEEVKKRAGYPARS